MTNDEIIRYLGGKDITSALWWYIENQGLCGSEVFFYLRGRVIAWQLASSPPNN